MLAIQKCERAGIKTTLVYNDVGEGPDDPGFIFAVPEADAIVSSGSRVQKVTLPKLDTVIGGDHLVDPDVDARGELVVPMRYLHGAVDRDHGPIRDLGLRAADRHLEVEVRVRRRLQQLLRRHVHPREPGRVGGHYEDRDAFVPR